MYLQCTPEIISDTYHILSEKHLLLLITNEPKEKGRNKDTKYLPKLYE